MGPALTDQPKNSKNGNSLVDECAFQSPPACVCWTPIVKQKSRNTPPLRHSVEGDCALNFWKGSLPPPKVLTRNLNSRHPGGAIYQFSAHLTVDFLGTKSRPIYLAEPAKSIILNRFTSEKLTNQNSPRSHAPGPWVSYGIDSKRCITLAIIGRPGRFVRARPSSPSSSP